MNERDDGGPAFPTPGFESRGEGLSLRDWFAGQALAGICANPTAKQTDRSISGAKALAGASYEIADAMLAERAKEKSDG